MDETAVSPVRFTPGPWQRIGADIGTATAGKLAMACVENGNAREGLKRMHANAALIAESPEMYELLKAVSIDLNGGPPIHAESVTRIRKLIARIEGE